MITGGTAVCVLIGMSKNAEIAKEKVKEKIEDQREEVKTLENKINKLKFGEEAGGK
ncbi:MAG: hypothetical protein LW832_01135 [Parachlamydia sp.]|jgi:hypothetical protein|nr:hypothetical protein [Parachlamydia sp.]